MQRVYGKMRLKAVTGIVLTVLLVGMLTLAFNIQLVRAQITELYYDDGGAENGIMLDANTTWGRCVKFDHPELGTEYFVLSAKIYIYWEASQRLRLFVYLYNPSALVYEKVYEGITDILYPGWNTVNLPANIVTDQDFFIGVNWVVTAPLLGTDDDTVCHSWVFNTTETTTIYDHRLYSLMIRALVAPKPPPPNYTLTITTTTGGTTSPLPGTHTYTQGTVVTVAASPYANYAFDHWELDSAWNYSNPINVTMDSDHTLHAVFTYYVTIKAYCYTESAYVSVSITMDGSSTGYTTPHTFAGLNGTHLFTVPSTDLQGHPFTGWSTGETKTTITVSSAGNYTAYYGGSRVGGISILVDKLALLAPYIGLASSILVATAATVIYVKRRKKKQ